LPAIVNEINVRFDTLDTPLVDAMGLIIDIQR